MLTINKAVAVIAVLLLGIWSPEASAADPKPEGEPAKKAAKKKKDPVAELFIAKCASCHSVGKGDRVGPDLKDVHKRRDRAWLTKMVATPSSMLTSDAEARKMLKKYKNVKMPDLGLKASQVKSLVELLDRCSKVACDLTPKFTPAVKATQEDIALGRSLFLGNTLLKKGGPSCISCHDVRGEGGVINGGQVGKDLTHVFARLNDEGLDAALRSPAFKLMNKIFQTHPLEAEEVFALRAFLYQSNRKPAPPQDGFSLLLFGILGAALSVVILNAGWSRRNRG